VGSGDSIGAPKQAADGATAAAQLRAAYRPSRRVRLASDIATICAVGILIGLVGSALTWWDRSALFDLAASSRQVVKMGSGYLAGPVLILIALPLVFGRGRQVALKRWFRARLLFAAALWVVGLLVLVDRVTGLHGYTTEAGTFVTAGLLLVGLAATLAMWPTGLAEVAVDREGRVRETTVRATA
jgi:hypothetical protein